MFKSIRKGGRIAAVAIGLIAALTPLATPPPRHSLTAYRRRSWRSRLLLMDTTY